MAIFSEELGEKVTKSNFRSSIERCQIKFSHFAQDHAQIGSVTICGDTIQNQNSSTDMQSHLQKTPTLHHDLSEMPNLGRFYNRTSELQNLKTLIFTDKAQILTLTGIIGIGKTALITQLVQEIKHQFEYVIWRSLETCPTVAQMQNSLRDDKEAKE
ncbi:NB-ARC domain-containing protein [Roseofilum sp. Belize Diploria]|nr:NB-ARC domain-containing protein [Roseofilum sp. Belize Diploria]